MNNYGTHKTALIRSWLAKSPRYHIHFTPTGGSWLNQVERWSTLLTQRAHQARCSHQQKPARTRNSRLHRGAQSKTQTLYLDEVC
jgi:hypothetical protein